MLKTHSYITNQHRVGLQTLEYAYPESTILLTYDVGKGKKTFYLKVGYVDGYLTARCKHDVAKACKEIILEHWGVKFNK